jgi:hypothetical protein
MKIQLVLSTKHRILTEGTYAKFRKPHQNMHVPLFWTGDASPGCWNEPPYSSVD